MNTTVASRKDSVPKRGKGGYGNKRGGSKPQLERKEPEWVPVTKLGRLVKAEKITKIDEIFASAIPIKESKIIDILVPGLIDEVVKIMPVQKQTRAGQRTRFKAFIIIGDTKGHVGVGVKCSKEVSTAVAGAINAAKLSIIPIRKGYWGVKLGLPHTIPIKSSGKCGSIRISLIPAPKGTGIVAAAIPKRLLQLAGIEDCYTSASGATSTAGNLLFATYRALEKTYKFITPDLWNQNRPPSHLMDLNASFLAAPPKNALRSEKDNEKEKVDKSFTLDDKKTKVQKITDSKNFTDNSINSTDNSRNNSKFTKDSEKNNNIRRDGQRNNIRKGDEKNNMRNDNYGANRPSRKKFSIKSQISSFTDNNQKNNLKAPNVEENQNKLNL